MMARDDTPSDSGTLRGSDLPTCFSEHEMMITQSRIAAKDDLRAFFFIGKDLVVDLKNVVKATKVIIYY